MGDPVPPLPVESSEPPPLPLTPAESNAARKIKISSDAAKIASSAELEKGEFDALARTDFPMLAAELSFLEQVGARQLNRPAPVSWQYHIRVFSKDDLILQYQLFVLVRNNGHYARYDSAAMSGGRILELTHVNMQRIDENQVAEIVGVELDERILRSHMDKPLRVQISRPDEGASFVIEIPSHYIAGVLAHFLPEEFEIEEASALAPDSGKESADASKVAVRIALLLFCGALAFGLFKMGSSDKSDSEVAAAASVESRETRADSSGAAPADESRVISTQNAPTAATAESQPMPMPMERGFLVANNCAGEITIALNYQNLGGEWVSNGWWKIAPGENSYLSEGGVKVQTRSPTWYFYAKSETGQWEGTESRFFDSETYSMIEVNDTDGGDNDIVLTCN